MDDDDDFGEFGGFEAAEPVSPQVAQPVNVSTSHWAVFPPSLISDTLRNDEALEQSSPDIAINLISDPDTCDAKVEDSSSQPLTVCLDAVTNDVQIEQKNLASFTVNSLDTNHAIHTKDTLQSNGSDCGSELFADGREFEKLTLNTLSTESAEQEKYDISEGEHKPTEIHLSEEDLSDHHYKRDMVSFSKEMELQEVKLTNKRLDQEVEELREQIKTQQEKYNQLQEKHIADLDEMRKAGHNAIAVIVDEYKELTTLAILQQKKSCETLIKDFLESSKLEYEDAIKHERNNLTETLDREQKISAQKLTKIIEVLEEKHRSDLETCLSEERIKCQDSIQAAIAVESEKSLKVIEIAIQDERKKAREFIEEEKERMVKIMQNERDQTKVFLEGVLEQQKHETNKVLESVLENERQRSEEIQRKILENSKEEARLCLAEQRKEDAAIRRRQLVSLDFFLESARKQLDLLVTASSDNADSKT